MPVPADIPVNALIIPVQRYEIKYGYLSHLILFFKVIEAGLRPHNK
jgi:hypothetical protein